MQAALVEHYLAEALCGWLTELSQKFPMSPVTGVLNNYLLVPGGDAEEPRIRYVAHDLYEIIKTFEALPDEMAYGEPEKPVELSYPEGGFKLDVIGHFEEGAD